VAQAAADARPGLDDLVGRFGRTVAWRLPVSRRLLERATAAGESPVGDGWGTRVHQEREYRRTRGIRGEAGRPTAQG
jgi:hypothetical protein